MVAWTNATRPTASDAGLLRPEEALRHFTLERPAAHPDLGPWVERYWTVRWSLPHGTSYASSVLTHPAVHLTVESGTGPRHGFAMPAALLHGVVTRRFDVTLRGEGRVFGVKFRPGGFGAFIGGDVAHWTDRVVPLDEVLDVGDLAERILACDDDNDRLVAMDEFLLARRPGHDPAYQQLIGIIADMLGSRELTGVQAVCERHGVGMRWLQRQFRRYVGVGPKWVLQRFRLHDAQAMLDDGWSGDLAELAARLGWFDQAHFARDFGDLVGVPPSRYP